MINALEWVFKLSLVLLHQIIGLPIWDILCETPLILNGEPETSLRNNTSQSVGADSCTSDPFGVWVYVFIYIEFEKGSEIHHVKDVMDCFLPVLIILIESVLGQTLLQSDPFHPYACGFVISFGISHKGTEISSADPIRCFTNQGHMGLAPCLQLASRALWQGLFGWS